MEILMGVIAVIGDITENFTKASIKKADIYANAAIEQATINANAAIEQADINAAKDKYNTSVTVVGATMIAGMATGVACMAMKGKAKKQEKEQNYDNSIKNRCGSINFSDSM